MKLQINNKQNIFFCSDSHYGHSHGNLDEFTSLTANSDWIGDQYYTKSYRTMDVGFDTHPEFRPYNFQELKEIMERRNVTIEVDHHNGE